MVGKTDFLPLGSIVVVKGGAQKALIISRGLVVKLTGDPVYFDYGAVFYPQGLVGDEIMYFNAEDIQKTVFEGYRDEDDALVLASLKEWLEESPFEKADTRKLREEQLHDKDGG